MANNTKHLSIKGYSIGWDKPPIMKKVWIFNDKMVIHLAHLEARRFQPDNPYTYLFWILGDDTRVPLEDYPHWMDFDTMAGMFLGFKPKVKK
jgi:hypothetical protein